METKNKAKISESDFIWSDAKNKKRETIQKVEALIKEAFVVPKKGEASDEERSEEAEDAIIVMASVRALNKFEDPEQACGMMLAARMGTDDGVYSLIYSFLRQKPDMIPLVKNACERAMRSVLIDKIGGALKGLESIFEKDNEGEEEICDDCKEELKQQKQQKDAPVQQGGTEEREF